MSTERLLATFVHISDLHFGDLDRSTGSASLDADAKKWWSRHRLFQGYLGHHHDALIHMEAFLSWIRNEDGEVHLIVTGDLTTVGKQSEFDLCITYLEDAIRLDPSNPIGLGLGSAGARTRTIPGNHDHWPGRRTIIGAATSAFGKVFTRLPIPISRIKLRDDLTVVFCGIDTDADVRTRGTSRILAQGNFITQLKQLEKELGPPGPDEVIVLLLHHSPCYRASGRTRAFEVHAASLTALNEIITRRGIAILLSGHIHIPACKIETVSSRGVQWEVMEARCGTTLVRDTVPLEWIKSSGAIPPALALNDNTLLVHRVYEVDDHVEWRTSWFVRTVNGFENRGAISPRSSIVVWPRP
jgi:3',5'-cyclic AMP phosphodiesterase CpdA